MKRLRNYCNTGKQIDPQISKSFPVKTCTIWVALIVQSIFVQFSYASVAQNQSSVQSGAVLSELAKKHSETGAYDSAIYYMRQAARAYIEQGDTLNHFAMRNAEANEFLKAGKQEISSEKFNSVIAEASDVYGANIVFTAYYNLGNMAVRRSDYEKGNAFFDLALQHYEDLGTKESVLALARLYISQGVVFRRHGDFEEAMKEYQKAEMLFEENEVIDPLVGVNYYQLAACTHSMYLVGRTEYYLKKQMEIMEQLPRLPGDRNVILNFKSRGDLATSRHAYDEAIELLNYALEVSYEAAPNDTYTPEIMEFLSKAYSNIGELDLAQNMLEKALELNIEKFGAGHWYVARDYTYLARFFSGIGEYTQAINNFKRASEAYKLLGAPFDTYDYPESRLFEGINLIRAGADTLAGLNMAKEALQLANQDPYARAYKLTSMYGYYGDIQYELNAFDSAADYYQKALVNGGSSFSSLDFNENPSSAQFTDGRTLLSLLTNKAKALEGAGRVDKQALMAAYHTTMVADTLANQLRKRPSILSDKLQYQVRISEINKLAFSITKALYNGTGEEKYLEEAFFFSEKDKSTLLLFDLQESMIDTDGSNVGMVLNGLENVDQAIGYFESKNLDKKDSAVIESNQKELLRLRTSRDSLVDLLNARNPEYYKAVYASEYLSLSEVQGYLPEGGTLLAYQLDDTSLSIFKINDQGPKLFQREVSPGFKSDIAAYLKALEQPAIGDSALNSFVNLNWRIAENLLPETLELNDDEQLIIVPNDLIALVPFETLLTSKPEITEGFGELDYLLKSHVVTQANSATLLARHHTRTSGSRNPGIVAFAPSYGLNGSDNLVDSVRSGLKSLKWTEREVESIQNHFKTNSIVGHKASERRFKELSSQYEVVHIASHGLLNVREPMQSKLVFSPGEKDSLNDGYLNVREIFNMSIQADMVVISACNSGAGSVISGEGVLSLANSFFHAGAKSLVMTLWTANDQSSWRLMDSFYDNLSMGLGKGESLREAKLQYLQQADGLLSHPYYWAHFIVNGDDRPLVRTAFPWYWLLLGLPIVFLLVRKRPRPGRT